MDTAFNTYIPTMSLSAAEVSEIITLNNEFWSSLFYTHSHCTENYEIHLMREFKDIPFLNAASVIRDASSLIKIERYMNSRKIPCSVFIECFSPLSKEELLQKGYVCNESSSEIWRMLNLKTNLPKPEVFLKNVNSQDLHVEIVNFDTCEPFLKMALESNDFLEAKFLIKKNIKNIANPDQVQLLLLHYQNRPAATIALGLFPRYAFLCLGATDPVFRGNGFFPYLRIYAAHIARLRGCESIVSNTELGNRISLVKGSETGFIPAFYHYLWTQKKREHHARSVR